MNTISLLNCFYREDVITDLIANLINYENKFANWFAEEMCHITDKEIKLRAYTRIGLGKGIGTPDLVVEVIKETETIGIFVIENKLGALEGIEQTNRYASVQSQSKLRTLLNVNENTPIHFIFLTLDSYTLAQNSIFTKKDYRIFTDVDWSKLIDDLNTAKIIQDYSSLLHQFYRPLDEITPEDNIVSATTDLDSLQKKLLWIQMTQYMQEELPDGFEITFGEANGFGRSSTVICFRKHSWKKDSHHDTKLSKNTVDIHFELYIDMLNHISSPSFALHYEPNPYKGKNKILAIAGYEEYDSMRTKRRDEFHQSIIRMKPINDFSLRYGSNSFLKIEIKEHQTFQLLIRELINCIVKLSPFVDDMLNID